MRGRAAQSPATSRREHARRDGGKREQPVDPRDEELQLLRARRALVRPWNRYELGRGGIRSALELKQAQAMQPRDHIGEVRHAADDAYLRDRDEHGYARCPALPG